ncbi:MAG: DUF2326 domain-containing protein [Candidatus Omnitrophica bacterium]|nr:DUF2326 domain-containing protein [Candidatus Omnitrophota bacterium]
MFIKNLKIENESKLIRNIPFHKGINLIVDETNTNDKTKSGNSVGKTTVLRLIDFCLGGDGKNIYSDPEYRHKGNMQIEKFLKQNNVIITLTLKEDLEDELSDEICIKRNFLSRKHKILEINGESYGIKDFPKKLKELIFHSKAEKPTFRQIISKNVRDEKNRLQNTTKVLHETTKAEEYEALFLFWLGIDLDVSDKKQRLISQIKIEENLQKRLRKENTTAQIEQFLIIVNRNILVLEQKKDGFNLNEEYEEDLSKLNHTKFNINKVSTELSRLELRKELIIESREELVKEVANIDTQKVKNIYAEAKALIGSVQRTFEETLRFHNEMLSEKEKYITQELPSIEVKLNSLRAEMGNYLYQEKVLSERLKKRGALEDLQIIIVELNKEYEKKGNLEEQKRLWDNTNSKINNCKIELDQIDKGIGSQGGLIKERVSEFNKYFSEISYRLYEEQFVLTADKNEKGYELNISTISGNPGTGKKKGQTAAFDLTYIQFADALGIDCLHFILQDQIENVHDNQISNLLTEIVSGINCQYILPVLRDKLPADVDIVKYEVLSLSQSNKLFRV